MQYLDIVYFTQRCSLKNILLTITLQVYLEISRLPAESGSNEYKCLFGTAQVDATVRANGDLRCRTPAKELLPQIADDTGNSESVKRSQWTLCQ